MRFSVSHLGVEYEVQGEWRDLGIGDYEYAGAPGFQTIWGVEVEQCTANGVEFQVEDVCGLQAAIDEQAPSRFGDSDD